MATLEADTKLQAPEHGFSLVRDDPLFRLQRWLGLIPGHGLGVVRRAFLFALLTWLPLASWAVVSQTFLPNAEGTSFLQNFGLHVRCLFSIPLLVLAEYTLETLLRSILPEFRRRGMLNHADEGRWAAILAGTTRLRCVPSAWILMAGIVIVYTGSNAFFTPRELPWLSVAAENRFNFGSFWFVYVVRPISTGLLLVWLWRMLLVLGVFWRISRLQLTLVPSHPDRFGGLGMLEMIPWALSPIVLALSAILSARIAYDMTFYGMPAEGFFLQITVFLVMMLVVVLLPQLAFIPMLMRSRVRALLEYGELLARQGALVRKRWVLRQSIPDDPILNAPELGPVVDLNSVYEAVARLNPSAVGLRSLIGPTLAGLLPLMPLVLIQISLQEVLKVLASTLL